MSRRLALLVAAAAAAATACAGCGGRGRYVTRVVFEVVPIGEMPARFAQRPDAIPAPGFVSLGRP